MARGSRGGGRRTDYTWFNIGDVESSQDISTATARFGTTFFNFNETGTLMRLRGRIGFTLNAAAVDEKVMCLVGIMALATDSTISGAAPEIFSNTADEASWIWQGALYAESGNEAAVNENFLTDRIDIDSKAMRRIKSNTSLALVFHTPAELVRDQGGTFSLTYYIHGLFGA